ncbi:MAG: hypothetical protein LBF12_06220 [Christensenellaceae bacterium]|jgi:hypothetical protein|nr:hypothetical protein [Christensenellaceae bacterium]
MEITCKKIDKCSTFDVSIKLNGVEAVNFFKMAYNLSKDTIIASGFRTGHVPFSVAMKQLDLPNFIDKYVTSVLEENYITIANTIIEKATELSENDPTVAFKQLSFLNTKTAYFIEKATPEEIEITLKADYFRELNFSEETLNKICNIPYITTNSLDSYLNEPRTAYSLSNILIHSSFEETPSVPISKSSMADFDYHFETLDENLILMQMDQKSNQFAMFMSIPLIPDYLVPDILGMRLHQSKKIKIHLSRDLINYKIFRSLFVNPVTRDKDIDILFCIKVLKIYKYNPFKLPDVVKQRGKFVSIEEFEYYYGELFKLVSRFEINNCFEGEAAVAILSDYNDIELRENSFITYKKDPKKLSLISVPIISNVFNYSDFINKQDSLSNSDKQLVSLIKCRDLNNALIANLNQNITYSQLIIEHIITNLIKEIFAYPIIHPHPKFPDFFDNITLLFEKLLALFEDEIDKATDAIPIYSPESFKIMAGRKGARLLDSIKNKYGIDAKRSIEQIIFNKGEFQKSPLYQLIKEARKYVLKQFDITNCNFLSNIEMTRNAIIRAFMINRSKKLKNNAASSNNNNNS